LVNITIKSGWIFLVFHKGIKSLIFVYL
jgi:hypothetical protein